MAGAWRATDAPRSWGINGLDPESAVLDLGCGSGVPVTEILIGQGLAVYGVDASPSLVSVFKHWWPSEHGSDLEPLMPWLHLWGKLFRSAIALSVPERPLLQYARLLIPVFPWCVAPLCCHAAATPATGLPRLRGELPRTVVPIGQTVLPDGAIRYSVDNRKCSRRREHCHGYWMIRWSIRTRSASGASIECSIVPPRIFRCSC